MPHEKDCCPSKWGADDQRGAANVMKPETVLAALKRAKTREIFLLVSANEVIE